MQSITTAGLDGWTAVTMVNTPPSLSHVLFLSIPLNQDLAPFEKLQLPN